MFLKPPSYPLSDLSSTSSKTAASLRFSPAIAPCRFAEEEGERRKFHFEPREAGEKETEKKREGEERGRKYFSFGKEAW